MSNINPALNIRTHFTLSESILTPKQIKQACLDLNLSKPVIVDTMSVSSLIEVAKMSDEKFQPAFGVRLEIVDDISLRDKKQPSYSVKVYPTDETGLRAIMTLVSVGFTEGHFYYRPRLSFNDVQEALQDGGVVISTGDNKSIFAHPEASQKLSEMASVIGWKNIYVELGANHNLYQDRINCEAIKFIQAHSDEAPGVVVTSASCYLPGEKSKFVAARAIHTNSTFGKEVFVEQPTANLGIQPVSEFMTDVRKCIELANTRIGVKTGDIWTRGLTSDFRDRLEYKWSKQPVSLPEISEDPDAELKELAKKGLVERTSKPVFGYQPTKADLVEKYLPRLKYELEVLETMGFSTYFLVVRDLVIWAKSQGIIVGPGRGSVGGSLIAFVLGITDVDPIRFDLLFERFINPSRNDLPDLDLDFMSSRREEVFQYLNDKYGEEFVAGISNYGTMGSSSSLRDIARVYGLQPFEVNCASLVPKEHGQPVSLEEARDQVAEILVFSEKHPQIFEIARQLQGTMRSYGKHAAGVVVGGVPLTDRSVVEIRKGERIINWDKRVSEDMGLVKLDILGLSTLDIIGKALEYIKERHGAEVNLEDIPLDDEETLAKFSRGETLGIFQFEGGAARKLLKNMAQVTPVTFDDLVAANALNRPGPIDAGLVDDYVNSKNGVGNIALPHENAENALKDTFNVIVYQEQVMQIAVDLAGFSLSEADGLRKAMGKKDKDKMASYQDKFVEGCAKVSGMEKVDSQYLWDVIAGFAAYAFNKSHAAEYSLISYLGMYLKANYPVEFYAAALSVVDESKLQPIVLDALENHIQVLPPDINQSEEDFVIANDTTLITPMTMVKNFSRKSMEAIKEVRQTSGKKITSPQDLKDELADRKLGRFCNSRAIENLEKVGAFANLPGHNQIHPMSPDRLRDQKTLMPGITAAFVPVNRVLPRDKHDLAVIRDIASRYSAEDEDAVHVLPLFGKNARFMVISDAPNFSEEKEKRFASGKASEFLDYSLAENGLKKSDAYWTGLLKRQKLEKMISPEEVKTYLPYLKEEMDTLHPPVILTLGSQAARQLVPDLKGNILDHVCTSHYSKELDATIIVGFNPGMIAFDSEKQDLLTDVFAKVKEVLDTA